MHMRSPISMHLSQPTGIEQDRGEGGEAALLMQGETHAHEIAYLYAYVIAHVYSRTEVKAGKAAP